MKKQTEMSHKLSTQEIAKISLLEASTGSFGYTVGSQIFLLSIKDPLSIPSFFLVWICIFILFYSAAFFTWVGGRKGNVTLTIKDISWLSVIRHTMSYAVLGAGSWVILYFISK